MDHLEVRRSGPEGGRGPRLGWLLAAVVAATLGWPPASAAGQGFGIFEQGTCTMGRGGAAVAEPCDDGSAIFFNPAGLAGTEGVTVSGGATLIHALGDFTSDRTGEETDLDNDPIPVPHAYASWGVNDRLAVGLGVFVPYGLTTEWPETFQGRFAGFDNTLQSAYIQPTVAYKLNEWVSVGAGFDAVLSRVEINQRLDLSDQQVPGAPGGTTFSALGIPPQTDFAESTLEDETAFGFGGNFGVRIRPHDRVSVGVRYLTQVEIDYEGEAEFEPVSTGITLPADNPFGAPAGTPLDAVLAQANLFSAGAPLENNQDIETEITMPDQLVAGVSVRPVDRLRVMADFVWTNWSKFDTVRIDFANQDEPQLRVEDYEDTSGIHVGAEFDVAPGWTARGGWFYNEEAAPDKTVTPLLPEAERQQGTVGLGWKASSLVEVNVAYQFVGQADRRGRVREPAPGEELSAEQLNNGVYNFAAHLFGGTVTLHF